MFTAIFPFCGLGAGARGFVDAEVRLLGQRATFRALGGIDIDPEGCADFERLTGAPAWCADLGEITAAELVQRYGALAPDVVFMSPPCKGASGLLSQEKSQTAKYLRMNGLALTWTRRMLEAWPDPPGLVLLENVPRLKSRAPAMLRSLRGLLRKAGYVLHDGYHDCGELGGLAQHRRRYLLVARLPRKVPPLLYKPPPRRVRGCGEVLGLLPLPEDPSAGPLHRLPRISWLNWVRLALIPAGGDWRDLPGVLDEGEARRAKWARHGVAAWDAPTGVVAGSGSNGVANVADPRPFTLGACRPGAHNNKYRVHDWASAAGTVIGATRPGSGAPAIADPRPREWFKGAFGVLPWDAPAGVVTSQGSTPSSGRFAVADPRVRRAFDAGYAVLRWDQAARTVAGTSAVGCGAYAVSDPRVDGLVPGLRAVTDEELAGCAAAPTKAPPFVPVILAADGTWHRPMTTLELAALQGFPMELGGEPLTLAGDAVSRWRERIGNAVPCPTATAIAEQMLVALVQARLEACALSAGEVWVDPAREIGANA